MAGQSNEIKIRYHILIKGEVQDQKYRKEIKKKADRCQVSGVVRDANMPNYQLEIILEGEEEAASEVFIWLLREPRLARIAHLNFNTKTFLDEFKDFQII